MKDFIKPGDMMTVPAPSGGATSGNGVLVGAMFGVAATTAAESAEVEIMTTGVHALAKTSAQAWTLGAKVYWDNTNKVVTTTASGNTLIGVAVAVAANPSDYGEVRLNGSF